MGSYERSGSLAREPHGGISHSFLGRCSTDFLSQGIVMHCIRFPNQDQEIVGLFKDLSNVERFGSTILEFQSTDKASQ